VFYVEKLTTNVCFKNFIFVYFFANSVTIILPVQWLLKVFLVRLCDWARPLDSRGFLTVVH